jgi:UDP-N-acetylglucosamine acyltransferase
MSVANSVTLIHPTAVISPQAELAPEVEVGPYCVIAEDVLVGQGTKLFSHVCLEPGARVGKNCQIYQGGVIAGKPQDLKFSGEKTYAYIGDNTVIREYVTVSRGTRHRGETRIGENCFLMAYAHVAHDCILGNNVILANSVNLAGHVEIEEYAIIGGVVPVHQFVRIGCHSIVGGGFRVQMDVCPYMLAAGYPLKIYGLNRIGLKRRGFSEKTLSILEKAYRIIFRSKLNTSDALKRIRQETELIPEIEKLISFIEKSERGIIK